MAVKTADIHRRHHALDPPLFFHIQSRSRGMVISGHFTPFGELIGRVSPGQNRLVVVRNGRKSSAPVNSLEKRMARQLTRIMLSRPGIMVEPGQAPQFAIQRWDSMGHRRYSMWSCIGLVVTPASIPWPEPLNRAASRANLLGASARRTLKHHFLLGWNPRFDADILAGCTPQAS